MHRMANVVYVEGIAVRPAMERTDGVERPVVIPGNPVKLSKMAEGPESRIPWVGEHTRAILADELGLDDDAIDALVADGVITD